MTAITQLATLWTLYPQPEAKIDQQQLLWQGFRFDLPEGWQPTAADWITTFLTQTNANKYPFTVILAVFGRHRHYYFSLHQPLVLFCPADCEQDHGPEDIEVYVDPVQFVRKTIATPDTVDAIDLAWNGRRCRIFAS